MPQGISKDKKLNERRNANRRWVIEQFDEVNGRIKSFHSSMILYLIFIVIISIVGIFVVGMNTTYTLSKLELDYSHYLDIEVISLYDTNVYLDENVSQYMCTENVQVVTMPNSSPCFPCQRLNTF